MKTIEEKAKAYDEAIEKGKQIQNTPYTAHWDIMKEVAEHLLPELKEGESEKIRKELIQYLKECNNLPNGQYCRADFFAWLEKQGEQKPAVPKFRIGDKVKKGYLTYTVEDIDEDSYKLQAYSKDGDKGCTVFLSIGYEKDYELVEQKPAETEKGAKGNEREIPISAWSEEDEARFESCIEVLQTSDGYDTINAKWLKSLKDRVQPKQEWSEEDKVKINRIVACLENLNVVDNDILLKDVAWLKSLKERYTWKPSDEQMEALEYYMHTLTCNEHKEILFGLYTDLKKLREE